MRHMKTAMNLKIPVSIFKEGKTFVAYSPVLDLSTSAKSFKIVQRRFNEVVQLFFDDLLERGTLNEVLTGLGWRRVQRQWAPPMQVSHELAGPLYRIERELDIMVHTHDFTKPIKLRPKDQLHSLASKVNRVIQAARKH